RDDQRLAAGPRGAGHIVEAQLPPIEELIGHIVQRRDPRIGAVLADDVARGAIENRWHLHPVTSVAAVAGAVDRAAALGESSESSQANRSGWGREKTVRARADSHSRRIAEVSS